jgi:hypothetical protein
MYTPEDIHFVSTNLLTLNQLLPAHRYSISIETGDIQTSGEKWDGFSVRDPLLLRASFIHKKDQTQSNYFSVNITKKDIYLIFEGPVNKVKKIVSLEAFLSERLKKIFSIYLNNEENPEVIENKLYQLIVFNN